MKTETIGRNTGLKQRKAALEKKLAELTHAATQREELAVESSPDELDVIRAAMDRDLIVQQLNQNDRLTRDIRAALQAIEAGEYGVCTECEEPIPSRRLDAIPWAQLCVRCQDLREQDGERNTGRTLLEAA